MYDSQITESQHPLDIGGMMQRSASTFIDSQSNLLDSSSVNISWDSFDPYDAWENPWNNQQQHNVSTNKIPSLVPALVPPTTSKDATLSDHTRKDSMVMRRPAYETGHFDRKNAKHVPQPDRDAFMTPVPTSDVLDLLSSAAKGWENTDAEGSPVAPREVCETHRGGLKLSKNVPLTPRPVNSRSSLSESKSNSPGLAPLEDEEMVDTQGQNKDLTTIHPNTEIVSKLRKHPAKFECSRPGCQKRFTRRVNLEAHTLAHFDSPLIHHCTECDRKFACIEDLRRHVRERHRRIKKQHVCGVLGTSGPEGCGQNFTRAEALRRHLRSKAGSKCGKPRQEEESEEEQSMTGDEASVSEREQRIGLATETVHIIADESTMSYEEALDYMYFTSEDVHPLNRAKIAHALRIIGECRKDPSFETHAKHIEQEVLGR